MNRTNKQKKVPVEVSVHLRFLHREMGLRGRELTRRCPEYSRASIYRHAKKRIEVGHTDKRHTNPGRPKKLIERDRRSLLQNIPKLRKTTCSFTIKRLSHAAGTANKVSHQTVGRLLHREGYRYFYSRKKGFLTEKDLQRRLKFAHKVRRLLPESFWRRGVAFYFEGAGFQHKLIRTTRQSQRKLWPGVDKMRGCYLVVQPKTHIVALVDEWQGSLSP